MPTHQRIVASLVVSLVGLADQYRAGSLFGRSPDGRVGRTLGPGFLAAIRVGTRPAAESPEGEPQSRQCIDL